MNTQKYCTKCGEELLPNNKFCVSCGTEIKSPERNFNVKNKTDNKNENYENLMKVISLIAVSLIVLAVLFFSDNSHDYSSQNSNFKNNSVTSLSYSPPYDSKKEENKTPKIFECSDTISNLFLMDDNYSYKLFDLSNWDIDIKFDSNEIKVFGIIKNSSEKCYATDIKMKFFLIRDDGEVMQEETFVLKETSSSANNLYINPGSTGEFSRVFKVYDSLIVGNYHKNLKPNIKVKSKIISAKWDYFVDYDKLIEHVKNTKILNN